MQQAVQKLPPMLQRDAGGLGQLQRIRKWAESSSEGELWRENIETKPNNTKTSETPGPMKQYEGGAHARDTMLDLRETCRGRGGLGYDNNNNDNDYKCEPRARRAIGTKVMHPF